MPGYISFGRDLLNTLKFKTKIHGACRTVLTYLLWEANFQPGVFEGMDLDRGDISVSVKTISKDTGLSTKTVRNVLRTLHAQKLIHQKGASKGANEKLVYNIDIYDIYIFKKDEGANEGASRGQVRGKQRANHEELKELKELKEVHQNPSPDGEGQAALPPPFEGGVSPPKKKRSRKPEEPADPLTNPNIFLNRVEADYPKTVLVRGRDAGIIKPILVARKRGGVADPQAEMWGCWVRFMDGEVDDTFKMQNRAHDVTSFVGQYALLIERAGENGKAVLRKGKETAQEKMLKWAEEEDRKEAEREQKGI